MDTSLDFESAMHHSPIGMAIVSTAGAWLAVNPAFCAMVGFSREELLALDFQSITHPADLEADLHCIERMLAREVEHYAVEKRYFHKQGHVVWVDLHVSLVWSKAGTPRHFIAQIVDITARRRAEREVRASEERLRQVTENLREVVWVRNGNGEVMYVSPAYEQIWGHSCESLYLEPRSWIHAVHPDDRERAIPPPAVYSGARYESEFRIIRPDGQMRHIHSQTFPVRDANGTVYRIAGIAEDITDRRRSEEQLRHAQKMEAIGQLAGGVAHDFNNILSTIMLEVDHVMRSRPVEAPLVDSFETIRGAVHRAANLTRQLLMFSRKQPMQPRTLDLNESVASLGKLLRRVVPESVELVIRPCAEPAWTYGDPCMLDQVLMNLVVNARDAMPSGGRLVIETQHRDLAEQEGVAAGRYVVLRVSDTGSGIAPDVLPRIFDPFFTTKVAGSGTGLGLATVFGIVKQHRGWVGVTSAVNDGSTFEIVLPIAAAPDTAVRAMPAVERRGGHETILVVEDDAAVRRLTRELLDGHGYRVLEASSGRDALALWDASPDRIDLLLTDLVMPGGCSGRDLATQLTSREPRLKVILTSGYCADLASRPPDPLNHCFVPKPCPPQTLLATVRTCLDQ